MPIRFELIAVALLCAATAFATHHLDATAERARAADYAEAANAKILATAQATLDTEHAAATKYNAISTKLEKDKANVKANLNTVLNGIADGTISLRDPYPIADNNAVSAVANTTSQCDGRATGELSKQATRFLFGEAARADEIVGQLTACQGLLR